MGKTPKKSTENYLRAIIHKDYLKELGDERCVQLVTKCCATQVARAIVDTTLSNDTTVSKDGISGVSSVFQTTM